MRRPLDGTPNGAPERNARPDNVRNDGEEYMPEQERRDLQRAIELSMREAKRDEKKRKKVEGRRGKKKR